MSSTTTNVYNVNSSQPLASYNLSSLSSGAAAGAGAGAITMAAAQAVQATAQVQYSLILANMLCLRRATDCFRVRLLN